MIICIVLYIILYCILYTMHYTLYTIHCTLCTIHYTLYTIHYTLYTIHYTLYTIYYTVMQYGSQAYSPSALQSASRLPGTLLDVAWIPSYTIHYTLSTIHYILYTIHYTLYTIHYILYCNVIWLPGIQSVGTSECLKVAWHPSRCCPQETA